jgi:hypothetical protein
MPAMHTTSVRTFLTSMWWRSWTELAILEAPAIAWLLSSPEAEAVEFPDRRSVAFGAISCALNLSTDPTKRLLLSLKIESDPVDVSDLTKSQRNCVRIGPADPGQHIAD